MKLIFPIVVAAALCFSAEKPIKFADLPAVVQKAMLKEVKGAKIKNTVVEVENGQTFYEAETVLNGRNRDILFDQKGNVVEIEEEMHLASAPAPVKAAVEKAAAGGKVTKFESVTKGGKITGYEAAVLKNGKKTEVALKPDGTPAKQP